MSGDRNGLATVLQMLGASGEAADAAGQDDLFEAQDAPGPLAPRGKSGPQGGRPQGARNKSTDEWVRYFLSQYKSPLTVLAEIYSRDVTELTAQLQAEADKHLRHKMTANGWEEQKVLVSPVDVLRLQRDAAVALLPYIHKKQPMAIETPGGRGGILLLGDLATDGGMSDDLALPLPPPQQNQQISDAEIVVSENDQSDDATNALNANDNRSRGN